MRTLSSKEEEVLRRDLLTGRPVRLEPSGGTAVPARLLSEMLLGIGSPEGTTPGVPLPTVVALTGAVVTGVLDLRHARGPGGGVLPELLLEDCTFTDPILLDGARVAALSLADSRLTGLSGVGLHCQGRLDLSRISPPGEAAECAVVLSELQVGGNFVAEGARLRLEPRPPEELDPEEPARYALCLRNGSFSSDVQLFPAFQARGGVRLRGAEIRGSLYLGGAELSAGEGMALLGTELEVRGGAQLDALHLLHGDIRPFTARGYVDLGRAHFSGDLMLSGAQFLSSAGDPGGLSLASAVVEGSLRMHPAVPAGVGRGLLPVRFQAQGEVDLSWLRVGRDLVLHSALVRDPGTGGGVRGWNLVVGGDLSMGVGAGGDRGDRRLGFECGRLHLDDARVEGSLHLAGRVGSPGEEGVVLSLEGVRVGRRLQVEDTRVEGGVDLRSGRIGGTFALHRVRVSGALMGGFLEVGQDVRLTEVVLGPATVLPRLRAGGDMVLQDLQLRGMRWQEPPRLGLRGARVAGEFRVQGIRATNDQSPSIQRALEAVSALRRRRLACYPGWWVVEALTRIRPGGDEAPSSIEERVPGSVAFLWTGRTERGSHPVLLDGSSRPIHEFNESNLRAGILTSGRASLDYLRFFAAYVWGDQGSFRLVDPFDPLLGAGPGPGAQAESPQVRWEDGGVNARGMVAFGDGLYRAWFRVERDGLVTMVDDDPVALIPEDSRERVAPPFRIAGAGFSGFPPSITGGALPWESVRLESDLGRRLRAGLAAALAPPPPTVDLEDASADRVEDGDGRGWGGRVRLHLDGFRYDRAPRPSQESLELGAWGGEDEAPGHAADPIARRERELVAWRELIGRAEGLRHRALPWLAPWSLVELEVPGRGGSPEAGEGPGEETRTLRLPFLWRDLPPGRVGRRAVLLREAVQGQLGPFGRPIRPRLADPGQALEYVRFLGRYAPSLLAASGEGGSAEGDGHDGARPDLPGPFPVEVELPDEAGGALRRFLVRWDGALEAVEPPEGEENPPGGPGEPVSGVFLPASARIDGPDVGWTDSPVDDAWAQRVRAELLHYLEELNDPPSAGPLASKGEGRTSPSGAVEPGGAAFSSARRRSGPGRSTPRRLAAAVAARVRAGGSWDPARVERRLRWLQLQFRGGEATRATYRPQPYEAAAAAFRNEGFNDGARRVLSAKLRTELRLEERPLHRWVGHLFGLGFDFGLSWGRAFVTFAVLWGMGWGATAYANRTGLMEMALSPAATVAVPLPPARGQGEGPPGTGAPEGVRMGLGSALVTSDGAVTRIPCGERILEIFYALDHLVPVLDLGQKGRCVVGASLPPDEPRPVRWWRAPTLWQILVPIYAIVGAVVISLGLLTISGVLRRHAES